MAVQYAYLGASDVCAFLREYTPRGGYQASDTNQLILNLKKSMDRRASPYEWRHKGLAIEQVARELEEAMAPFAWFRRATLVPMPPSAAKGSDEYDDRLVRVLQKIGLPLDVRELLVARASRRPAHESGQRPSPSDHNANLEIDESQVDPAPTEIGIFDDLLTSGAGFVGAKRRLVERFPGVRVVGIFIARVVHPDPTDGSAAPIPEQ